MRLRAVFLQTSALVAGAMLIGADPARAADFDWIGATSTYETSTNWNPNLANGPSQAGQSATFSGSGNTSIVVSGAKAPDAWTFSGATSYTVSGASINFGGAGLTNNATANQAISNNLRGSALNQAGAGTLTISGSNLFTSVSVTAGTLINSGDLVSSTALSNNAGFSNTGILDSSLSNNAAGTASNTGTINQSVTNSGTFTQTAGFVGGVTNTGTINANGGTFGGITNNAGSVIVGGAVGGNSVTNANGATFRVNAGGSFSASGLFTNAGNVTVVSGGSFRGPGGINNTSTGVWNGNITEPGPTALVNNGIINGDVTLGLRAQLSGNGTIVGTTTLNDSRLLPGNNNGTLSIGTLTFQGNLALASGTIYFVDVDPNGADRLNVTGTASLRDNSQVWVTFANGSYVMRRYTILNAQGGVSGTFAYLVTASILPAGFTPRLNYDANNVYLDLALSFPGTPSSPGTPSAPAAPTFTPLTNNQLSVANAVVNSFNAAGGIPLVFGALTRDGLTALSGEHATGAQQTTFDAMDKFVNLLTDPFIGTRAGDVATAAASGYADENESLAYAAKRQRSGAGRDAYAAFKAPPRAATFERRWSVWGTGYGGTQQTSGDAATGSQKFTDHVYGGAAGFDYRLDPNTFVGFSLGGAGTTYGLANGLGGGRADMFQAGIYGRHTAGPAYVSGAVAWGWQDTTLNRTVGANGYRANFDANAITGRLEGGWRFAYGASGITPYAAGQVTAFYLPGFAEQLVAGVNTFALSYADKDVTATRSELGLRGDTSFTAADAIVTLRGRAAWAHNFNVTRDATALFQTLPASTFVVNGAAQAHDSALVSAGAEAKWLNGFSVAATFEGEFSNVTESYAGKGTLRYQW